VSATVQAKAVGVGAEVQAKAVGVRASAVRVGAEVPPATRAPASAEMEAEVEAARAA
jgi:hypothetical protein